MIVMACYRVEINGQNFLIEMDGRLGRYGFFTTRFVEALDPVGAENAAIQRIRETQHLRDSVRNSPDDRPVMDVTLIAELESFDGIANREQGFVWYEENPRRWWQFWRRRSP